MEGNDKRNEINQVRVELKYCEGCGGLWVRECGAGTIYCQHCDSKIMELPRVRRRRAKLPVAKRTVLNEPDIEDTSDEEPRYGVDGGVA